MKRLWKFLFGPTRRELEIEKWNEEERARLRRRAAHIKKIASDLIDADKSKRRCDEAYVVVSVEKLLLIWDSADHLTQDI